MNKKIITNISIISLLTACSFGPKPYDTELLKNNSISNTIKAYGKYEKVTENEETIKKHRIGTADKDLAACLGSILYLPFFPFVCSYMSLKDKPYDYTTLAEKDTLDCLYLNNNSDKCIIYRRNHKKEDSSVHFFDYKRFLPKNSNVKTDYDFLLLVNKYKEYKNDENNELKYCDGIHKDNSLTSTERDEKYTQCKADNENKKNKIEELLRSYILEGGLEEEKKQKQLQEELERQKEEFEKQRRIEYRNDCDQAEKKADEAKEKLENYKKQIGYSYIDDLNEYKVVDFADEGVMLQRNYTSPRYFVYTKDKNYANGDYFRGGEYYYKKSNNVYKYTTVSGGTNSISVLVPTKYKIKDIDKNIEEMKKKTDYHSHLRNKNILSCGYGIGDWSWGEIEYTNEDGEKVYIERNKK